MPVGLVGGAELGQVPLIPVNNQILILVSLRSGGGGGNHTKAARRPQRRAALHNKRWPATQPEEGGCIEPVFWMIGLASRTLGNCCWQCSKGTPCGASSGGGCRPAAARGGGAGAEHGLRDQTGCIRDLGGWVSKLAEERRH